MLKRLAGDLRTQRDEPEAIITFRLVASLRDALIVRRLRNLCRQHLTNFQGEIGLLAQARWYFAHYRKDVRESKYRVFLFSRRDGSPIGFGALRLENDNLLITECVHPGLRGNGYGKFILRQMISTANREGRDIIAEIWASNDRSISLHEKRGFTLESSATQQNKELRKYRLKASAQAPSSQLL